jgi:hypothetical protein
MSTTLMRDPSKNVWLSAEYEFCMGDVRFSATKLSTAEVYFFEGHTKPKKYGVFDRFLMRIGFAPKKEDEKTIEQAYLAARLQYEKLLDSKDPLVPDSAVPTRDLVNQIHARHS